MARAQMLCDAKKMTEEIVKALAADEPGIPDNGAYRQQSLADCSGSGQSRIGLLYSRT